MAYGSFGGSWSGAANAATKSLSDFAATPEEENWLKSTGLTALQAVGNVLDAPRGALWALLAGQNPLEALFNPDARPTGEDVLRNLGVDEGWGRTLGGIGLEIVGDPLNLITGGLTGAATKSAKFAEKAGLLRHLPIDVKTGKYLAESGELLGKRAFLRQATPESLVRQAGKKGAKSAAEAQVAVDDVARVMGLAGQELDDVLKGNLRKGVGFKIPFTDALRWEGDMPGTQAWDAIKDAVGGYARGSYPGIQLTKLFDKTVRETGAADNVGALGLQRLTSAATDKVSERTKNLQVQFASWDQAFRDVGITDPDSFVTLKAAGELSKPTGGKFDNTFDAVDFRFPGLPDTKKVQVAQTLDHVKNEQRKAFDEFMASGGNTAEWKSAHADYLSEQRTDQYKQKHERSVSIPTAIKGRRYPGKQFVKDKAVTEAAALRDEPFYDLIVADRNKKLVNQATPDQLDEIAGLAGGTSTMGWPLLSRASYELSDMTVDHADKVLAALKRRGGLDPNTVIQEIEAMRTVKPGPLLAEKLGREPLEHGLRTYYGYTDDTFADIALKNAQMRLHAKDPSILGLTPDELKAIDGELKGHAQNIIGTKALAGQLLDRGMNLGKEGLKELPYKNSLAVDAAIETTKLLERSSFINEVLKPTAAEWIERLDPLAGVAADKVAFLDVLKDAKLAMTPEAYLAFWRGTDAVPGMAKHMLDANKITQQQFNMIVGNHPVYSSLRAGLNPREQKLYAKLTRTVGREASYNALPDQLQQAGQMLNAGAAPDAVKLLRQAAELLRGTNKSWGRNSRGLSDIADKLETAWAGLAGYTVGQQNVQMQALIKQANLMPRLGHLMARIASDGSLNAAKRGLQALDAKMLSPRLDGLLDVHQLYLPKAMAKDMLSGLSSFDPRAMSALGEKYDKFMATFKSLQTFPWPGFNIRNLYNILHQHVAGGGGDPNRAGPMKYLGPMMEMKTIMDGGTVKGIANKLKLRGELLPNGTYSLITDDAEATEVVRAMMASFNVASDRTLHSVASDITGVQAQAADLHSFVDIMPGKNPQKIGPLGIPEFGRGLKSMVTEGRWRPGALEGGFESLGAGDPLKEFGPVKSGKKVSNYFESFGRGSTFLGKLYQGYVPHEAAAFANAAHIDYSTLSRFEQRVVKRAIPFYSFARGVIPWTIRDLANNPGGLVSHEIRALNSLSKDQEGFVPPEIAMGLGIRMGQGQDGRTNYLTQIDLPFETLNDYLRVGSNPLDIGSHFAQTAKSITSQSAPWLKGGAELAFGRNLYTGRDLRTEDSDLGRIIANLKGEKYESVGPSNTEKLLKSTILSPASRAISTVRQLTDTRKSGPEYAGQNLLNMFTGARVKGIDVESAKEMASLNRLKETLKGGPFIQGEYITVKKSDKETMSPDQQRLFELYKGQRRKIEERRKEKAKQ